MPVTMSLRLIFLGLVTCLLEAPCAQVPTKIVSDNEKGGAVQSKDGSRFAVSAHVKADLKIVNGQTKLTVPWSLADVEAEAMTPLSIRIAAKKRNGNRNEPEEAKVSWRSVVPSARPGDPPAEAKVTVFSSHANGLNVDVSQGNQPQPQVSSASSRLIVLRVGESLTARIAGSERFLASWRVSLPASLVGSLDPDDGTGSNQEVFRHSKYEGRLTNSPLMFSSNARFRFTAKEPADSVVIEVKGDDPESPSTTTIKVRILAQDQALNLSREPATSLREGQSFTLKASTKIGDVIKNFEPGDLKVVANDLDQVDKGLQFKTKMSGNFTLKVKAVAEEWTSLPEATLNVSVDPGLDRLVVLESAASLLVGERKSYRIALLDKNGQAVEIEPKWNVRASVETGNDEERRLEATVEENSTGGLSLRVKGVSVGEQKVQLTLSGPESGDVTGEVIFSVAGVGSFRTADVRIDMVDEVTAKYLFGEAVNREYFVGKVRVFNRLHDGDDQRYVGQSILAYSESLEVGIQMMKRPHGSKKNNWIPVQESDFLEEFGVTDSNPENPVPVLLVTYQGSPDKSESEVVANVRSLPPVELSVGDVVHLITEKESAASVGEWGSVFKDDNGRGQDVALVIGNVLRAVSPGTIVFKKTVTVDNKSRAYLVHVRVKDSSPTPPVTVELGKAIGASVKVGSVIVIKVNNQQSEQTIKKIKAAGPSGGVEVIDAASGLVKANKPGQSVLELVTEDGNSEKSSFVVLTIDSPTGRSLPPSTYYSGGRLYRARGLFRYRPYSADVMIYTTDVRQQTTGTANFARAIQGASSVASWLVSSEIWKGDGNKFAAGLSALVIPTFNTLAPRFDANERANLQKLTFAALEEIPYGGDISRYVFFPKGTLKGVLSNHDVRISSIDTSYFAIQVAIIQKLSRPASSGD
ncbi:MAG: hypothetical protein KF884_08510 [Fimbriimonadaceae bacterium]|nr:hypothetical protein [Fimbriimonadaceae bacterium]QYK57591.1 MAG: hypothetical protein KF884_08510 [Fimbriimonadaceae bacterium]